MWLEIKSILSMFAFIFIGVVLAHTLAVNMFLSFLLIASLGLVFMGDVIIGYQISHNHLKPLIDPIPSHKELGILLTIGGMVDFVVTNKAPLGKREFSYYNRESRAMSEASVINDGSYPIRTINGNPGFIAHESYDMNVDVREAKALEQIEGDDIKDIYHSIKKHKKIPFKVPKIKWRKGGNRARR